ncbi:unnamed protein product, partial [Symbiodinium microadriaticum]
MLAADQEVSQEPSCGGSSARESTGPNAGIFKVPLPSLQLTATSALLALPRPVLMRLPGFQKAVAERWPSLRCTDRDFPATVTEGATTTKVY